MTAIAAAWRGSLNKSARRKFDKITMRKLAKSMFGLHSGQDNSLLNEKWVANIPEEIKRRIAWGNALTVKKK